MSHRSTPNPNRATAFRTGAPRKDPPGRPSVEELQARYAIDPLFPYAGQGRGRTSPASLKPRIVEMFAAGKSVCEVCGALGINVKAVRRLFPEYRTRRWA